MPMPMPGGQWWYLNARFPGYSIKPRFRVLTESGKLYAIYGSVRRHHATDAGTVEAGVIDRE